MGSSELGPETTMNNIHVFMVSFPGHGHVSPLLRLGKGLASLGLFVSFSAPAFVGQSIRKAHNITSAEPIQLGRGMIRFEFFHDGWELDDPNRRHLDSYMAQLELVGRKEVSRMIQKQADMGRPVSCLVNNPFVPWVSDVAEILGIPNAVLWVQSSACFSFYYHYHENLIPFPSENEPEIDVQLPFMPLLKYDEVPSFLHPRTPYSFLAKPILDQFKYMSKSFCILMDTFDELEHEIIAHMSKISRPIKTIGPLFKSIGPNSKLNAIRGDISTADDCIKWLDTKSPLSVVYVAFGSVVHLDQEQIDEIAHGLLELGFSFLWVMKPPIAEFNAGPHVLPEGFLEEAGEKGKVVQWSPQVEVLAHPATACFVTHCGWNSTVEALASAVPVVAFPQWGDQVTNAKFLVDVYGVGIRMGRGESEGRIVGRNEVARCLRAAIGGVKAADIKENALKWKQAAVAAVAEGGSSQNNILDFVNEIVRFRRSK